MCVSIKNITDELKLIGTANKNGLVTTALLTSEMLFVVRNSIKSMFTSGKITVIELNEGPNRTQAQKTNMQENPN